jgi:hypothetical protein
MFGSETIVETQSPFGTTVVEEKSGPFGFGHQEKIIERDQWGN